MKKNKKECEEKPISSQGSLEFKNFSSKCPLKLSKFPNQTCPLGLQRAQWYYYNKNHNANEEKTAPGCQWGILSEENHDYCFFKMMADHDYISKNSNDSDICRVLNISKDQVDKIFVTALNKIKNSDFFVELQKYQKKYGGMIESEEPVDNTIFYDNIFDSDEMISQGIVEEQFQPTIEPEKK